MGTAGMSDGAIFQVVDIVDFEAVVKIAASKSVDDVIKTFAGVDIGSVKVVGEEPGLHFR